MPTMHQQLAHVHRTMHRICLVIIVLMYVEPKDKIVYSTTWYTCDKVQAVIYYRRESSSSSVAMLYILSVHVIRALSFHKLF